jgi:hypothetical protein
MKYLKYILIFLAFVSFSCEKEGMLLTRDDIPNGVYVTLEIDNNVIDAADLAGSPVSGTFDAPSGNVASHAISVRRIFNAGSDTSDYLLLETITEFPTEWVLTANELADAFGISMDDAYGDYYEFECEATGTDGSVATFQNLDADITGSSGQLQGFRFTAMYVCPSDPSLIVGTYDCVSNGVSTDGDTPTPVAVDLQYVVTISETDREGYYEISDFSGGCYIYWYEVYGIDFETPGIIQDICGVYQYVETIGPFGAPQWASVIVHGDGTISIDGSNGWGDTWQMELTKQ